MTRIAKSSLNSYRACREYARHSRPGADRLRAGESLSLPETVGTLSSALAAAPMGSDIEINVCGQLLRRLAPCASSSRNGDSPLMASFVKAWKNVTRARMLVRDLTEGEQDKSLQCVEYLLQDRRCAECPLDSRFVVAPMGEEFESFVRISATQMSVLVMFTVPRGRLTPTALSAASGVAIVGDTPREREIHAILGERFESWWSASEQRGESGEYAVPGPMIVTV